MRTFLLAIAVTGCGGGKTTIDAAPLDCSTYCTEIQANCTAANAQYLDTAHCMATCASFTVGASTTTDTAGDTLGCRIYHAGAPSVMAAATNCPHAGPAGDLITASPPAFCSGGDVCTSFCALEIQACGSLDVPLPGNPTDATNNPLWQYRNMGDCMQSCANYDKTHAYSTSAMGNSLACRLLQATSAAISVTPNGKMYCAYTADFARGPCVGTPSP